MTPKPAVYFVVLSFCDTLSLVSLFYCFMLLLVYVDYAKTFSGMGKPSDAETRQFVGVFYVFSFLTCLFSCFLFIFDDTKTFNGIRRQKHAPKTRPDAPTPNSHSKNSLSKICSKGRVAQKPFC